MYCSFNFLFRIFVDNLNHFKIMELHLNQNRYAADQRKYYGQTVMAIIRHLNNAATLNDLIRYVGIAYGQPIEVVAERVERALRAGVHLGFIVKHGNIYLLPSHTYDSLDENMN